jgi:rhodanese-related sulfurtransferase
MDEVLQAYPGAQRALMRRYHIGGCSSCGFAPNEQLGDVLARHNLLNTAEVIDHIHSAHEQEQRIQITAADLKSSMSSVAPPRLLDVRTPEERQIASIDGSIHATQSVAQQMMSTWPKDAPIVVYCHHGLRSLDAASYLIGHGFTNVRSLAGGIDAWSAQIDPSVPRY